jgi:hypothetical protein
VAGRNWKAVGATSLSHAMELCLEFARERHNRSVEGVADLMGLANKFTLYKWVESGKLPAISIRTFEHACGCDFVTRYLAHSSSKLLIAIPIGRKPQPDDTQLLMASCSRATGLLIDFYSGKVSVDQAVVAITQAMEEFAWHRANMAKVPAPELDFK